MTHRDYSHRSLLDKLNLKAGQRASLIGTFEDTFIQEVEAHGLDLSLRARNSSDQVLLYVEGLRELGKVSGLAARLAPAGGLWVIYPKGRKDITENDVLEEGRAAGLTDNKVVSFSDTHTALRFVIPVAKR